MCMDSDASRIASIHEGIMPIFEPGLDSLIEQNRALGTQHFTSNAQDAVAYADVIFIAVGTPPDEDGSADLKYVLAVATEVGRLMTQDKIIVTKSTVPVGTRDAALVGADALIICTEWQHFRAADFEQLAQTLNDKVIFDGRNLYDPAKVAARGLTYYAIGRGASVRTP